MRATVMAVPVVAALVAPALAATPIQCVVLTDPTGDVAVSGLPQTEGRLDDAHVDVEGASVAVAGRTLYARIDAADLSDSRKGTWRLSFVTRGRRAFVSASIGMWINAGDTQAASGFSAGITGGAAKDVSGTIDYGADVIDVRVPVSVFGAAAPRPGDVLSQFRVEATERLVHVGPAGLGGTDITLADTAASTGRHTAGRAC